MQTVKLQRAGGLDNNRLHSVGARDVRHTRPVRQRQVGGGIHETIQADRHIHHIQPVAAGEPGDFADPHR